MDVTSAANGDNRHAWQATGSMIKISTLTFSISHKSQEMLSTLARRGSASSARPVRRYFSEELIEERSGETGAGMI